MVQDRRLGKALMLRDTQGVAPSHVVLPMEVIPIVARFAGNATCEEIARALTKEAGDTVPVSIVVQLASELEEALFLDGAPYRKERARIEKAFADAPVRPASHAGGAYHDDPTKLADYIKTQCLRAANGKPTSTATSTATSTKRLNALVAPHIDPWRGAVCYGAAYNAFAQALPADADTFVLLGTSHAPMREPFALCRKAFATPLGQVDADLESIDAIAKACDFDPYADQFNHKREHSLEFQAVFLRHMLGKRKARIIPILAGLGEQQNTGDSPSASKSIGKFLDAVRKVVEATNAVVIAGADLAHVGPRFGDPRPLDDKERRVLDDKDRESLDRATGVDAEGFWTHVSDDLDTRRVCGLAPVYSLLRVIDPKSKGELRHYEQTVDPDEGSIVSHAAVGFYL
jgi:AmmeMemoRadiSam system protein B